MLIFNITINYIEEKITPEFDDDFIAENLPDYESAEAYRQSVYDNLYKQNMYNALFQYVVEIPRSKMYRKRLLIQFTMSVISIYLYRIYVRCRNRCFLICKWT